MASMKFNIKEIKRNFLRYNEEFRAKVKVRDCHCLNCKRDFIDNELISVVKFTDTDIEDKVICGECANSLNNLNRKTEGSKEVLPFGLRGDDIEMISDALNYITFEREDILSYLYYLRNEIAEFKQIEKTWEIKCDEDIETLLNEVRGETTE